MSLAEDLLEQAEFLARRESGRPRQASLRRAISSAYYSLFHLLVREGAHSLVTDADLRSLTARAFDHTEMKKVCRVFGSQGPLPENLRPFGPVPHDLQYVASTFVQLQEARHKADYDIGQTFLRSQATSFVLQTRKAFEAWSAVKSQPVTRVFLAALLLAKKWDR